jgi:pimeloyl-ACP methyl ester carboxylesterase
VPLVVLSAGDANQSQHKDLATLSPISKHIICNSCGHYVHQDKPELLTEALEWVFDKI